MRGVISAVNDHTLTIHVDQPKANELWITCACGWEGTPHRAIDGDESTFDRERGRAMYYAQGHIITALLDRIDLLEAVAEAAREITDPMVLTTGGNPGVLDDLRSALSALNEGGK